MTNNFWTKLNHHLEKIDLQPIAEDENILFEWIKDQLHEQTIAKIAESKANFQLNVVQQRAELQMKTVEMFLFYIKESLVIPYNVSLTHRERDGINQLITAKIDQFKENICTQNHYLDNEF